MKLTCTWHAWQVPIAEGAEKTLLGIAKSMYADFVHGQDGFGNTNQPSVKVRLHMPAQKAPAKTMMCTEPTTSLSL